MFLKKLDLIGGNIGFNYDRFYFNSILGGVFSMFLITCLSLLIIAFGRDFYKRINPSFIRQTIFPDIPPLYTVNNKNFTIAFRFEDNDGSLINRTDAFYLEAEYITNVRNENGDSFDSKSELLNMLQCTEDLFQSKENFEYGAFQNWFCPKLDNILFGGSYAGDFASTIKINFYFCPEGDINKQTKEKCVSSEDLQKISSNLVYMNIAAQLPFVTPGDYEKGLKTKVLYNWYALDFNYHKIVFTYFMNYTMITDYGWILENSKIESHLMMNKQVLDFMDLNLIKPKNKLGSFWLFSDTDNGTELFKRKYVKIQQLLAEIGGFMNFLFTFGGYIVHSYNNNQYYNKLMTHYYPEDQCSNSDSPIKNSNKMDIIFNNLKVFETNKEFQNHNKNLHENSSSKIKNEEKSNCKLNNNFVNNINDTKKIRNIEYLSKISELNNLSDNKCNKLENKSEISDSMQYLNLKSMQIIF